MGWCRLASDPNASDILPHFAKTPARPAVEDEGRSKMKCAVEDAGGRGRGETEIMPTVRVKENEPFEVAMRRFKRTVEKTGLLTELRAREFYEKPTSERKRKKAAAIKRHFKRLRGQQLPPRLY